MPHREDSELWQEEAKKLGGNFLVQIIKELRDGQQTIIDRLDVMETRNEKTDQLVDKLNCAFPAGDIDGHRRYHELVIQLLAEKRRLRIAIQEKTISALVWVVLVALGSFVWKAIVTFVKG